MLDECFGMISTNRSIKNSSISCQKSLVLQSIVKAQGFKAPRVHNACVCGLNSNSIFFIPSGLINTTSLEQDHTVNQPAFVQVQVKSRRNTETSFASQTIESEDFSTYRIH